MTFLTESACHNQLGDFWQYRDKYEYQFKMYAFVHQCCCLSFIYKPKGARTAKRQRRWERKEMIIAGSGTVDVQPRLKIGPKA